MRYELEVETGLDALRLAQLLNKEGIKLLGVKTLQYFFPVNLTSDGELIDSVNVLASDETEALDKAYRLFRNGYDYDVIRAKDITKDMVELDRGH